MLFVRACSKHALFNAALVALALIAVALVGATSAHAQADNFLNGDGHDGTVTFPAGTHVPNAVAPVSGAVPAGATSITIGATVNGTGSNAVGFATNRLVMIYQSNGVASAPTSGSQAAYPLSNSTAGHWEFARLTAATLTTLTVSSTTPLIHSYAAGATQVIAVPEYNGVTIATGATINPPAWNGSTGGVVVMLAQGTLNVAGTGTVSAAGLGFRGGLSYLNNVSEAHNCSLTAYDSPGTDGFGQKGEGFFATAYATTTAPVPANGQKGRGNQINAGGGGNCFNAGGGGGGHIGQGGQGGNTLNQAPGSNIAAGGLGGAALTYNSYRQIPMGGGGGNGDRDDANSGAGARGGGVVYVRGGTLTGTGTFSANGAAGTGGNNVGSPFDGAGGGGAGGSVVLRFVNGAACTSATATGGTGGNNGTSGSFTWTPGGGGGGGSAYVQGSTVTCARTVTGGPRGTGGSNAGATAGGNGTGTPNATSLTKPVVTLASPVNGSNYQTLPANINGTATTGSTVYIYIDGVFVTTASAAAGTWTFATPALAQGQHTVMVFSDVNGSQSDQSSATFTYDNVAPAAPVITTPAAATTYTSDTTPTVGGTAEANSTVNVYRAGNVLIGTTTANGSGNWTLDTSALAAGSHTITARATDAAGNQGVASASKTIVVDTTAPSVSLTAPANGSATNDSTPPVTFSLTETNQGTSRCVIDGVLPGTVCTSGGSLAALADGSYTLTIQHTDLAGNIGTSATHAFTVDTTAPVAPSVSSPASPFTTNDQTPAFAGLAEPNNNVYIYVDGILNSVTFSNGSGNWTMDLGTVAVGVHSVYVTSMDAAGNTSPQSAPSRSLTIDTTAPAVTVTSPASNGLTVGPNGNITFTATDAVGPVTTTCQIDATPAVSCTSPFAYSSLANGGHTFTVTATDAANNSMPAVRTFTVDAVAPNTSITANPAAVTNSTNASFSFTSTESPATFECQLDGNPLASCTSPRAYSGLTEGSHTFFVRSTDQYGNVDASPASYTWTIDTTAPIAPTISTPGSDIVTSDTTPAVGGLAEPGSTVRVYEGVTLIGTAVANGGGVWALSPDPTLSVGSHALIARATDPAGNVSPDSGPRTIVIDTAAPTVTLSAPANGSTTNSATPAITFSVGDANPSPASTCTIDGGTPVVCTTGYTPPALGDGTHTVVVSHTDLAGNVGTSATHTFTVDTLAPGAPTITSGPSAPVASTSASFGFTGEPGATYECYIDSPVSWVSCSSPTTYNSLAQGAHTFHVRQIDAGGNVGPESTRSWSVDTVGPPAPSVSGPSGTVGSTSATIDFNDTESPVTYMCSLNAAPATLCTSPVNLTGLADGAHTYEVYAVDQLGNAGSPASINWTVDSSLFTAGITDGPLGTVATSANSLSFTATIISGTTFMCRVDAAPFASCTSPLATGSLPDGSHTFEVYAVNGSQTSATVSRTWTIDTTGPSVSITSPTNGATVGANGNVVFSATDATGPISYTCQIDSGAAVGCGSPFVFTNLTNGAHSVTVVATDGVGNNAVAVRNFNVDATPPQTTITSNPPTATSSTSATFGFSSSESPSTFECQLDSQPIAPCTSTTTYTSLTEASHTFNVRAIDQYGNVDQSPASYTWTVDLTAPVAPSINTPSSNLVTTDTTPAVGGLAEPNSTVRVYEGVTLIGTATANGAGAWSLSPDPTFAEGPHVLTATSTDGAGNTSASSSARTITIDLTDPVATITSPLTGAYVNTASPNITFTATDTNLASVQCSLDGAPATACTSPWPTSGLSEALHTVVVLATDAAGRQATATTTFRVDLTDPDPPVITSPGADLFTVNQTPSLSGSAEPNATITIYDNAVQVGQVAADGTGNWSWTSPTTVSEAAHPYVVTATDQAGNVSADSNTRTITVDLTAPLAPVITSPATDISTASVRPPIGGTSEANALISVYDGATLLGTTPADGAGAWSFTPVADLNEGPHVFTATATDAADNTGPASGPRTVTIDLTAPAAPAITTPAQNLTTAVNTQPIGGTADLDTTVTVYDGAVLIGTATTDPSGNWALSPDPTFTEGVHTITAWATDQAGNTSSASSPRVITIDNTAPAVPAISSPTDGAVLADPTPDVIGSADPGSTVDVYDGAVLYCTTTASGTGDWSCAGTTALSEGDHTFTATATDPSGNESAPTADVVVTIDLTNPSVSISSPIDGSTVATSTPAISFTATDSNLDTIECRIGLDAFAACTSPWTTASLSDGVHVVSVRATDEAGNTATATSTFIVDTTAPVTTIAQTPNARDNNPTPTFTFSVTGGPATAECRIVPDAFAPCTSPYTAPTLSDGEHTFEVRSTDLHGNTESPAQSHTWTVDTVAPGKPVVTAPVDASTTGDNTPTISGTAEADASVQVYIDGSPIGTVTANGSGQWTITAPTALTDGLHSVSAQATDAAGNAGAAADSVVFTVDTTPPDATVAAQPGTGGGTTAPTYNIQTSDGTATIRCSVDGAVASVCSSPFTPSGTFAPGTHTLVVTFTDTVGNVTTRTMTFVIAGVAVTPPSASAPANSDPLPQACFAKGIAISNLAVVSGKVVVSGFARLRYAGQKVTLSYKPTGSKVVATGTVGIDGSFTASAPAPAKKLLLSNKTLYRATVGDESTPWTKLARRVASSTATYKSGKLIVSGVLSKPLMPKTPVTISARTGCSGPWVTITKGKVGSNGAFSTSSPYTVSTGVVFVRVAAVVSKGGKKPKALRTYSFVMPVVLR